MFSDLFTQPAEVEGVDQQRLRSEQVRMLYDSLPLSLVTVSINSVILAVIQARVVPQWHVLLWLCLAIAVITLRYYSLYDYRRQRNPVFTTGLPWLKRFNIGAIISGALWGCAALLLFPHENNVHQIFLLIVLTGMSAGAMSTLSAHPFAIHSFLGLCLIPMIARLIWEGGDFSNLLAAMTLMFYIIVSLSARRVYQSIMTALTTRFAHEGALKELQESNEQNRLLLESVAEGIFGTNMDGITTFVNPAASRMLGYEPEELIGKPMHTMIHYRWPDGSHYPRSACPMSATLQAGMKRHVTDEVLWRKDGTPLPVEYNSTPIMKNGGVTGAVVTFSDISEQKLAQKQLERQAFYDSLTQLPNRRLLLDRLEQAMVRSQRHSHMGALLFLDLDQFKMINDSLGHPLGDALLKQVALRLGDAIRSEDTAARMGGDEFVVLFAEVSDDPEMTAKFTQEIAEKIRQQISEPYYFEGHTLHITPSIGIALFPLTNESADDILMQADTAMYRAKELGRNGVQFFLPSMQLLAEERLALQNDLRLALGRKEFQLWYQPQFNAEGDIVGAEALLRWLHPQRGMVSPADFIPLAEETGLILAIGDWVLRSACELLRQHANKDSDSYIPCLAINVSPRQFRQSDFVGQVQSVIRQSEIDPSRLELELTEGMLVDDVEDAIDKMRALKALGVRFSIDDFGTGYSSLAYLKNLPLNKLKIDQSFIHDVPDDAGDVAIVDTIIAMTHHLGLEVVAEGVETESQLNSLIQMGCHLFQGYLFSRPVAEERFIQQLCDKRA